MALQAELEATITRLVSVRNMRDQTNNVIDDLRGTLERLVKSAHDKCTEEVVAVVVGDTVYLVEEDGDFTTVPLVKV